MEKRGSLQGTKEWAMVRKSRVSVDYTCNQIVIKSSAESGDRGRVELLAQW